MGLVNVTPHEITILDEDRRTVLVTLPPSGQVARCAVTRALVGGVPLEGVYLVGAHDPRSPWVEVPVFTSTFGELQGLPDPQPGVIYVCSLVAHQAAVAAGRTDTVSPGELVRGPDGQPVGCVGLSR